MDLSLFPPLNASLNAVTAFLLALGYALARRRAPAAHKVCMLSACATSVLFLVGYLYYHFHHGITHFPGQGAVRSVYFLVLVSHTALAVVIVPLVIATLVRAFRGEFEKHRKIARVTLPLWFYVSVTGVAVYWMLYRVKYS